MLNKKQLEGVNSTGNTIVFAPAGSGKTKTLIARVKRIIDSNPESSILTIAFNKSLPDMIKNRLGENYSKKSNVQTFHAFCLKEILKQTDKKVLDESRQVSFFKGIWEDYYVSKRGESLYENILKFIYKLSSFRNKLSTLDDIESEIYDKYNDYKKSYNYVDFDDMLELMLDLIRNGKVEHYDYVFVDEFQDFNYYQWKILEYLIANATETFVVGDPKQAIYSFRGGHSKYMFEFEELYSQNSITLETSYRCSDMVLSLSNHVALDIDKSISKSIHNKGNVLLYNTTDVDIFVDKVLNNIGDDKIAFLVATNRKVKQIIDSLQHMAIQYNASEKNISFNLKLYLGRIYADNGITNNYSRTYRRMSKSKTAYKYKFLKALNKSEQNINDWSVMELYTAFGALNSKDKLLLTDLSFTNEKVKLDTVLRYFEAENPQAYVGTIHSAKGLEWDNVAILLDKTFPNDSSDVEESFTTLYTAVTRTKHNLFIGYDNDNILYYKFIKYWRQIHEV